MPVNSDILLLIRITALALNLQASNSHIHILNGYLHLNIDFRLIKMDKSWFENSAPGNELKSEEIGHRPDVHVFQKRIWITKTKIS